MAKQQKSSNDLTHWDVASDFSGDEVTALVLGSDPSSVDYIGSTKKPLYRKLETAYNAARRWHALDDSALVLWDEIGVSSEEELLLSIDVAQALQHFGHDETENLARWLASVECSNFSSQRFARAEVARWLSAIGLESVYQFTGIPKPSIEGTGGHWPWGNHHTKSLGYLEQAAKKWWVNYDPSDVTTAPLNKDVVAWLKKEFSLSENRALAIASMLRGDDIPTGPHS